MNISKIANFNRVFIIVFYGYTSISGTCNVVYDRNHKRSPETSLKYSHKVFQFRIHVAYSWRSPLECILITKGQSYLLAVIKCYFRAGVGAAVPRSRAASLGARRPSGRAPRNAPSRLAVRSDRRRRPQPRHGVLRAYTQCYLHYNLRLHFTLLLRKLKKLCIAHFII